MRSTFLAIASLFVAATQAQGTIWVATGDQMAGGTFSVTFSAAPAGTASVGPFTAPIVAAAGATGTATVVPDPIGNPGNTVTFTVAGSTWTATWTIANAVAGVTIASVSIDLSTSTRPSVFDDGSTPSTAKSAKGRRYTWIAGGGFAVDPLAAAGDVFLLPALPKNIGDLWFDLDLGFTAGAFVSGNTLNFKADTDVPLDAVPPTTCDTTECSPIGACCLDNLNTCQDNVPEGDCKSLNGIPRQGFLCANMDTCNIPAVSEWGLVAMTLLVLSAATVVLLRRRAQDDGGVIST